MPTALVTSTPERVQDIAIALKTAGFDILTAGPLSDDVLPLLPPGATVLVVTEAPAAAPDQSTPESRPWWLYADVDSDLSFADWRNSMMCLSSLTT